MLLIRSFHIYVFQKLVFNRVFSKLATIKTGNGSCARIVDAAAGNAHMPCINYYCNIICR